MVRYISSAVATITIAIILIVFLIPASTPGRIPNIYAQEKILQNTSGWGQSVLPGDIPTLFSFKAIEQDGTISGNFECFAVMPDGNTMYVKGTVTNITKSDNGSSVIISGPAVVTGFGNGTGTFEAIATQPAPEDGVGGNGTLVLTTDVNGDGIQGNMPDGSEGPFNEDIVKGSFSISP